MSKRYSYVSSTFLLKLHCICQNTDHALSTIFLHIFDECCRNYTSQNLSVQKLLCFGTKNVGEIDPWLAKLVRKNPLIVFQRYTILQFFFNLKNCISYFAIWRLSPNSLHSESYYMTKSFISIQNSIQLMKGTLTFLTSCYKNGL